MNVVRYIGAMVLLAGLSVGLVAQEKQTMVYLEHSETLNYDESIRRDAQILRGNVCFRHDDALMYCDSAYFYEKTNSLDAFGHVRMVQGDTLSGYGDVLYYDGNTKVARLRRNVRLIHTNTTLKTDSLNYDRGRNLAYYFTGGSIQDSLNTLVSRWGQYMPETKQALFRKDVKLTNPNFTLEADTLKYNTETKIANLVGPTTIVYEEETTILSTRGWYNTDTERSLLLDRSRVVHSDGKTMVADSIYYDKRLGYGRLIGRMELTDSVQHATLYGEYGEAHEAKDMVGSHGFATDSALLVDWSDSLHYMYTHADSLFSEQILYTMIREEDSVSIDTSYSQVRAYHNVRVFRDDVQAVCDSMDYNDRDSVMTLHIMPICWSDSNQLSADVIHIYMKNKTVDRMHGIGNALTVKQETDTYFDQMSGKEIQGFVRDEELKEVHVSGNAETVFYPKDETEGYVGMNVTQSSFVKVYLEEQKIHHILFTSETTGTLYPIDQIPSGKDRLSGFFWAESERPMKPGDVFLRPVRTPRPGSAAISATAAPEEEPQGEENAKPKKKRMNNRKATR